MQPRPITYRAEIIEPALASIVAGECCSIVGMSGVGKSNLVQHLLRADVLRHYLGDQADTLRFVTFDTNMLADWSAWGVFEGLIEALLSALTSELPHDVVSRLHAGHQQVLAATGEHTIALRQCAEILSLLCVQWRIVLLFDEFDSLFAQLAGSVLRNLRGLRDRHKYRLMYLTFSRQPLISLRDEADWDEIEPFIELLSLRELGLTPLRDQDAAMEVERFAKRHNHTLQRESLPRIVALSGGHPALLRALAQEALLAEKTIALQAEQIQRLPAIRLECTKIWQQLGGDEQDDLLAAAHAGKLNASNVQPLILKGLLYAHPGGKFTIFSPLFQAYLATLSDPPTSELPAPLHIDTQRKTVIYYGRDISGNLSPLEYRLLAYLWEHYGKICSVAETAAAIHPREATVYLDEHSEFERVRILARRLRHRLTTLVPDQPVPLSIYRRRGYQLGI